MERHSVALVPTVGLALAALVLAGGAHQAGAQEAYAAVDLEEMQALLGGGAGAARDATAGKPVDERSQEASDGTPGKRNPCGLAVTVAHGDTLSRIARRCDTSVEALMDANAHIHDPQHISVGATLIMPGADTHMPRYVVGSDDTLASIAGELHLPAKALVQVNPEVDPDTLAPGQVLRVPPGWADDFDAGEGPVSMTGVVTTVQCPALRGPDGRLYALAGAVEQFQPGDRVEVQGQRAEVIWCLPGAGIEVGQIRPSG